MSTLVKFWPLIAALVAGMTAVGEARYRLILHEEQIEALRKRVATQEQSWTEVHRLQCKICWHLHVSNCGSTCEPYRPFEITTP